MDPLITGILASTSLLGLGFAAVSLVLHWVRRREPVEVSELREEITHVRAELLELMDKTEHWIKRDRVRRIREGKENANDAAQGNGPVDRATYKRQLRARAQQQFRGAS